MSVKKLLVHVHFYIWFIFKIEFLSKIIEIISSLVSLLYTGQIVMNPSPPPVPPCTSLFLLPQSSYHLICTLFCHFNHFNLFIFWCPTLFYHTLPWAGGWSRKNLTGALGVRNPFFCLHFLFKQICFILPVPFVSSQLFYDLRSTTYIGIFQELFQEININYIIGRSQIYVGLARRRGLDRGWVAV